MVSLEIGDPAPLGLLAFAMTTACLMYVDMGWAEPEFKELVWGYAFWYGGVAQLIVGVLELLKGNTFGGTAFSTYGCFWLGWAAMWHEYKEGHFGGAHSFEHGEVLWLCSFGVVTFGFWILTLRKNACLMAVFGLLALTFFLLAGGVFNKGVKTVAGYFGFATALAATYTAFAELFAREWGTHVLPGLQPFRGKNCVTSAVMDKRITYDKKSNTLVMDFKDLKVCTQEDVSTIEAAIREKALGAGQKVDAVVNYHGFDITSDLMQAYQSMVKGVQREHYQSVRRWHIDMFEESAQSFEV